MQNTDSIIGLLEKQVELLAEESQKRMDQHEWEALPGLGLTMASAVNVIAELTGTASDNAVKRIREQVQLLTEANERRFTGELIARTEAMIELVKTYVKLR